jgi:hypothetical protein
LTGGIFVSERRGAETEADADAVASESGVEGTMTAALWAAATAVGTLVTMRTRGVRILMFELQER